MAPPPPLSPALQRGKAQDRSGPDCCRKEPSPLFHLSSPLCGDDSCLKFSPTPSPTSQQLACVSLGCLLTLNAIATNGLLFLSTPASPPDAPGLAAMPPFTRPLVYKAPVWGCLLTSFCGPSSFCLSLSLLPCSLHSCQPPSFSGLSRSRGLTWNPIPQMYPAMTAPT